ncbi:topoisomerase II-associated protein PAT1-domain-containing protein, partial [Jimgerdemannia flammicorona]
SHTSLPSLSGTYSPTFANTSDLSRYPAPHGFVPAAPPGFSPGGTQQRARAAISVEELEAELHKTAGRFPGMPQAEAKKMLSLAEVEAAFMATSINGRSPQQQVSYSGIGYPPDPTAAMAMRVQQEAMEAMAMETDRRRREKMMKLTEIARYNNLMTQHDKDFIHRIQLSQLASDDPYSDDFYYQVYSAIRQRAGFTMGPPPAGALVPGMMNADGNNNTGRFGGGGGGRQGYGPHGGGRREENAMWKMQQHVQRIVSDAKRRPKQTQLSLEGALGKITVHSVRNPRQLLQVSGTKHPVAGATSGDGTVGQEKVCTGLHVFF